MVKTITKFGILGILFIMLTINLNAQKRTALIWGNATYKGKDWQNLPIVKNDVQTMDKVLTDLGFQTTTLTDGNLEEMRNSLNEFLKKSKNAELVVFYYSGHATRIDDRYYLIPAKTDFGSTEFTSNYFSAKDIETATRHIQARLFFFDACRDRYELNGQTKGVNSNISQPLIGPSSNKTSGNYNIPKGIMMCYATEEGRKAYTGDGKLSLFTKVLSKHLYDVEEWRTVWFDYIYNESIALGQEPKSDQGFTDDLYLNPGGVKQIIIEPIVSKNISIKPDVPGAHIIIKEKNYDAGATFSWKIGETYTFAITAEGYDTYNGSVTVTESTPSTINITMKKTAPATLRVTSNKKAKVKFDDKDVGKTPVTINTLSGTHKLTLSANGYYGYNSKIKLDAGDNSQNISLTRKTPWFFDWNEYDSPKNFISYTFSPKYQLGLQYLYKFEDSHFLLGGNIAFSTGFFRGWKKGVDVQIKTQTSNSTIVIVDENGNPVVYNAASTTTWLYDYSDFIDPYNEAQSYNSNFMFLLTGGYQPCNGLIFEIGVGPATHCEKIYMPRIYGSKETIVTDMVTGEVIGDPQYSYSIDDRSRWYKGPVECNFATRFGMKFNIPVGDCLITLGGGYTYLISNDEFSSWDVSIGFAFDANSGGNWW